MTDQEIEELARQRLAAEEVRITGARRTQKVTLRAAFAEYLRHPSPWMIAGTFAALLTARVVVGDWRLSDAWGPIVLLAVFPVMEWTIHVFILHWRPRKVGPVRIDTELARDHRRHHADPRAIALVFIPWRSLIGVIVGYNAIALLAFPRVGQALSFMLTIAVVGSIYEWTHYLLHTDYKPKSAFYRKVWRNHRLHHYKSEKYWFTVTTAGTADRLFGTCPDPATVPTSPTAKNLHGLDA